MRELERESPKRTISTGGEFDCYKWYQSQTPGGVPARTLTPGVDCEIPRWLEREQSMVWNLFLVDAFKKKSERENPKKGELGWYKCNL